MSLPQVSFDNETNNHVTDIGRRLHDKPVLDKVGLRLWSSQVERTVEILEGTRDTLSDILIW